jgi:acetyltransferase-like isoleucine patch superfamily enzyme
MNLLKKVILRWLVFLPSPLKIPIYRFLYHYQIGRNVRIGKSFIKVDTLFIDNNVIIGDNNRFENIPEVHIGAYSTIGNDNTFTSSYEFTSQDSRKIRKNNPRLHIGSHCGISFYNYFDIQDEFTIGNFTTIAGVYSIFFTHYLNVIESAQSVKPISIGSYCMLGARVSLVPGAKIPDYCVVGMGSVITKPFLENHCLIGGNPAKVVKKFDKNARYFKRKMGYISSVTKPPFNLV